MASLENFFTNKGVVNLFAKCSFKVPASRIPKLDRNVLILDSRHLKTHAFRVWENKVFIHVLFTVRLYRWHYATPGVLCKLIVWLALSSLWRLWWFWSLNRILYLLIRFLFNFLILLCCKSGFIPSLRLYELSYFPAWPSKYFRRCFIGLDDFSWT